MKILWVIAAFILGLVSNAALAETLTNEQIVQLSAAGLGDQVLIAKIKASDTSFDTSTTGLLALRKKGVSNPVIAAMIGAGVPAPKSAATGPSTARETSISPDSPDPRVPHPAGIYLLADWRSPTRMVAVDSITSDRTKSGNLIAYVLTGGLAKRSRKAVIREAKARTGTPRPRPIFYFFFNDGHASDQAGGAFWNVDRVTSPDDFSLIRFDVSKAGREAKIGSSNLMGSSSGIPEKDRLPFTVLQISPGVYCVQPENRLENGEYGFLYSSGGSSTGTVGGGGERVRIFDFSVDDGTGKNGKKE